MKTDIVHEKKGVVFITTKTVSEMLEVPHKVLMSTVDRIVERSKNNVTAMPLKFPQLFLPKTFKNKMGREYPMYEMNEQAYMKLAMHLKGYEKAELVQDSIIEAFSLMKESLLNHENASWLSARKNGKQIRSEEMDVVKKFVDYAINQGSKSAKKYFMNVTKMTNKALEMLVQSNHGGSLRDMASIHELGYIQVIDNRAAQAIEYGMNQGLPYKFIYQYAKEQVNELADILDFNKSIEK